ncbi:unnamed protein product [Phaedon cochleariae]|uniref:DNA2/NAM7 helicase-like C-terminal domain-containing protein n=1 Tax=Phaedon cochleariae TaxID=80249 RepID=A0A9N9SF47_PHACE|nr:unnamed protein product [Phaedon cochleariae]
MFQEAEFDKPKIGTVEEFQGQEFEVVLLSTVRSCEEHVPADITHSLGFVASLKMLNVAISRTKSLLVGIVNPNCFKIPILAFCGQILCRSWELYWL